MGAWKKIDPMVVVTDHSQLTTEDCCWHRREYLVDPASKEAAFKLSDTNQIIHNLKVEPLLKKSRPDLWQYKSEAIQLFAEELAALPLKQLTFFSAVPCSSVPDHPEFDDRLDQVLNKAAKINPRIRVSNAVHRVKTIEKSHRRAGYRSPKLHRGSLAFYRLPDIIPNDRLYLLDDVLTSGSTFKACQQVICEARSDITVCGIFWARRIQARSRE